MQRFRSLLRAALLSFFTLTGFLSAQAYQVSSNISYHGLLSVGGLPYEGTNTFVFEVLDEGGSAVWTSSSVVLDVKAGVYQHTLTIPAPLLYPTNKYSIRVTAAGEVVSPDIELVSVPYALYAGNIAWSNIINMPIGFSDGIDHSADAVWVTNASDIYFNAGNVGIGTGTPGAKLDVRGVISSYQPAANHLGLQVSADAGNQAIVELNSGSIDGG